MEKAEAYRPGRRTKKGQHKIPALINRGMGSAIRREGGGLENPVFRGLRRMRLGGT